MSKRIHVQYFALLREQRGESSETVQTDAANAEELYESLAQEHNLSLRREQLRVAVNEEYAEWDRPIAEGDTVVFVPPVAGG